MKKLLLLHGALGNSQSMMPLASALENDFEIHVLTFKGHGSNVLAESDFSIAVFADEVRHYLAQNQIDKINIFGYSMGGYVGLYLARHFPDTVEKLYTLATKINWTPEGAAKDAALLNPKIIKEKVPKYAAALAQLHGENWEALMQQTAKMMLDLGKSPILSDTDFAQIATPVLLSVGDKDTMVSIEETTNAYKNLPQGALVVMPDTIHPLERVNFDWLAKRIKQFLLD